MHTETGTFKALNLTDGEVVTVHACAGETLAAPVVARVEILDRSARFVSVEAGTAATQNHLNGARRATITR